MLVLDTASFFHILQMHHSHLLLLLKKWISLSLCFGYFLGSFS